MALAAPSKPPPRTMLCLLALWLAAAAPSPSAAYNLTWGELGEAVRPHRGATSASDVFLPPCDTSVVHPGLDEPRLCIVHSNCSRQSCLLLFELDEAFTARPTTEKPETEPERPSSAAVWGWGVLSVGVISLSGIFGGLLWPVLNSKYYATVMRYLIGLAAGCLSATSIFQLIPESLNIAGKEGHLETGLLMWASIWILYFCETACKIAFSDSPDVARNAVAAMETGGVALKEIPPNSNHDGHPPERDGLLTNHNHVNHANNCKPVKPAPKPHGHSHGPKGEGLAAVAWMVILGDGLHNFVDGMSIGAGYSQSVTTGLSISLAIACEEFPHELGDFAILINSGVSFKKALLLNFASACTAFAGLVLGVLIGEVHYSYLIFAFAGGLFLYIALSSLTPELKSMVDEQLAEKGRTAAACALLLQTAGYVSGCVVLYVITRYNDSIKV